MCAESERMITIADALRAATRRLAEQGFPSPRLDAEVLLRHVLGLDRTAFFLRLHDPLSPADRQRFEALLARRLAGEPVAYLTGEREFMGLPFAVGPGVLVPRPETELLVEWALAWLTDRTPATVIDVGTGSGAIALSLAYHLAGNTGYRIIGSDISRAALRFAQENRSRLGLERRVHLVCGDLVAWCRGPVDLILANLPYLRPDQIAANPDLAAEPRLALEAGPDGLDLYRRLLADTGRVLAPGGAIGLEIDPSQADAAVALVQAALPDASITVRPDLAGLPRHVIAERSPALGYDARGK
ncbi:MAG: release factor glutamine methyltransferase [Thermomicrobiales bacterium]|nr:MAG: release factor glutamine methyltransferase [Thermomicrobiales bacterium]